TIDGFQYPQLVLDFLLERRRVNQKTIHSESKCTTTRSGFKMENMPIAARLRSVLPPPERQRGAPGLMTLVTARRSGWPRRLPDPQKSPQAPRSYSPFSTVIAQDCGGGETLHVKQCPTSFASFNVKRVRATGLREA